MATALHSARTRFFDKCGKPLCGGTVHTYQAGTTTAKPTYTDVNKTAVNTNPVILDSIGSAAIFLDGAYRVRVLDRNGVLVEDIAYIESWISATEKDALYTSIEDVSGSLSSHVAKNDNPHGVTKAQVGLGNVDNTADIDKPVSNAVESALLTKADKIDTYTKSETDSKISTLSSTTYAGHKGYATLADAQAAQASLPANTVVEVTNDTTAANNGVYLWNGTTLTKSTYDALGQAKTYTDSRINSAFDTVISGSKNKFDKSLAKDLGYRVYNTGGFVDYANGMNFGKQAVAEGNTYIWWLPNTLIALGTVLLCYDKNSVYLGTHSLQGTNPVAPNPPTNVVFSDSNHQVTFTIPVGSDIGYISINNGGLAAHTANDFTNAINAMQLEIGAVKTAYEPYTPPTNSLVLKQSALPQTAATATTANTFTITLNATDAYVRTAFSDSLDLVQQIKYGTNDTWSNNVINPYTVKTIAKSTAKDAVISAFTSGTTLINQGDDAAPLRYNGTYIGANHGAYIVHEITANNHGKTYADVGSQWVNGTLNYTIVRIVDANKLWVVSQNTGTTTWQFDITTLASKTLTHVSGATNTASIAVTADTITQLLSAVNNHTKKIIADGYRELSASGVYDVEYVEFIDSYNIMQPTAILSYLQSKVGTTTEQKLNIDSIASDVHVGVTYRIALNGSITVNTQLYKKGNISFDFAGLTQANPPSFGGKKLIEYAPKIKPVTVSGTAYDLTATIDATNNTALINLLKSDWLDPTNPPDHMLQLVRNGTTNEFGHVLGYSLVRGDTKPSIRQNTTDAGGFNNPTTKKMYPKALVTSLDTVVNAIAYRSVFNSAVLPQATVFTWYQDNNDIYVVLDMHQNASYLKLPLPSLFNNKTATVIDSNANFTLHSEIVSDSGLLVSVTNNYGQATIKLS